MAQEQAAAAAPQGSPISMFLPMIIVVVVFYFLIFRPQQKQQKVRKQMLGELKRGDEVITNGGIYGKVTDLAEAYVMLQIAGNVVVKLDRSQINTVLNPVSDKKES
ncbi:MAG: preprotein translocase subunit YajC [Deltaproteobacteria bacterium GWA2_45_12]|nr:MAG: preprotein translocase subunit YajC [Deltaproteobacteria bacterium GWA2_45_12]